MLGLGNKNSTSESSAINLIGTGTRITGDIVSGGDVRIDGTLIGNISIKGRLVIGAEGKIEGEINCQNADISGEIKGRLTVTQMLALKATAKIAGDIVTGKLAIEPGANFTGTCSMGAIVKTIHNNVGEKPVSSQTA